jgi:hypothetical protein
METIQRPVVRILSTLYVHLELCQAAKGNRSARKSSRSLLCSKIDTPVFSVGILIHAEKQRSFFTIGNSSHPCLINP